MIFEMNWQHRIPVRETSNDFMIDLRRKQIHISHEVPCLKVREIHKQEQNTTTIMKTSINNPLSAWKHYCHGAPGASEHWWLLADCDPTADPGGLFPGCGLHLQERETNRISMKFMWFSFPWIPTEFPEFQWISWDFHEYLLEKYGKMANRSLIVHWFSIFTWHASQR